MPLPIVPAPMTSTALSVGSARLSNVDCSAIDRLRGLEGRARERCRPATRPGAARCRASPARRSGSRGSRARSRSSRGRSRSGVSASACASSSSSFSAARVFSSNASISAGSGTSRSRSLRQRMSASSRPSPSACQRSACHLSAPCFGNRRALREIVRYSQMTTESNSVKPSSSTSVGIFDSGLSSISRAFGLSMAATDRTSSRRSTSAELVRADHHLAHVGRLRGPMQFQRHQTTPAPRSAAMSVGAVAELARGSRRYFLDFSGTGRVPAARSAA